MITRAGLRLLRASASPKKTFRSLCTLKSAIRLPSRVYGFISSFPSMLLIDNRARLVVITSSNVGVRISTPSVANHDALRTELDAPGAASPDLWDRIEDHQRQEIRRGRRVTSLTLMPSSKRTAEMKPGTSAAWPP